MGTCAREWEISPQFVSIGMILKAARFWNFPTIVCSSW